MWYGLLFVDKFHIRERLKKSSKKKKVEYKSLKASSPTVVQILIVAPISYTIFLGLGKCPLKVCGIQQS